MLDIECLPDELWLEIFSYVPYSELFRCFTNLNQRINRILLSKRIQIELKSKTQYEKCKTLLKSLPEYIISLSIKYSNQNIDISPFKNLLSLHISHATTKQLHDIQTHSFKYLNQLNIVVCPTDFPLGDFLFSSKKLNYLTTCWFPNFDSYFKTKQNYQFCLTLRSLRLNYSHINTFFKLLNLLPNLNSFETALVPIQISEQTINYPLAEHFNLSRLKICLRANVPFNDLQTMLMHVPSLEQFYLNINEENFDLISFSTFVRTRLLQLKKCNITINSTLNHFKINLDDLKNLNSLSDPVNLQTSNTCLPPISDRYRIFLSKTHFSYPSSIVQKS